MIQADRRQILGWAGAAWLTAAGTCRAAIAGARLGPARPFGWEALQEQARLLAARPWRAPARIGGADAIDYDAAGTLAYRPEATLAGGIRLFPLGRHAQAPVKVHIVEGGLAREVAFAPDLFEARGKAHALGLAGFRAMTPDGKSDWMAFAGASYFRTAGSQDQYGLSARGVAVDTGIVGREEFPAFTTFWIERTGAQAYIVHALLEGASLTGAYRFVSRFNAAGTGAGVVQDVSCVLYLRRDIERLGIAPATSMFWYGEGDRARGSDWRPEIHDSDGLALWTGADERIWRPLANPVHDSLNSFADTNPRGFGLIQRDRRFASYQDDGAFYDKRPNLWIEPRGQWGKGAVMLYAFPTGDETVDNVVAFWHPAEPAKAGARLAYDYRLSWTSQDLSADRAAHAVDFWRGAAGRPGQPVIAGAQKLVVDFMGAGLAGLDRSSGVEARIGVAHGKALASAAYPVVGQPNRWRVTADIEPNGGRADVRIYLARGPAALSETVIAEVG